MARYNLRDPRDYLAALDYINQMKEQGQDIDLKKFSPSRSNRQNAYLHLILSYFAHRYGCTLIECKEIYFKKYACRDIFLADAVDKAGNHISYYRSTADLSKDEMSGAIRNFIAYADMHGIELPQADDYLAQRICEREIEKTIIFGT
jgi:hypothetical protein